MKAWSKAKIDYIRKLRKKEGLLIDTIATAQEMLKISNRPPIDGLTVVRVEGQSFILPGSISIEVLKLIDKCAREELDEVSKEIKEQVES